MLFQSVTKNFFVKTSKIMLTVMLSRPQLSRPRLHQKFKKQDLKFKTENETSKFVDIANIFEKTVVSTSEVIIFELPEKRNHARSWAWWLGLGCWLRFISLACSGGIQNFYFSHSGLTNTTFSHYHSPRRQTKLEQYRQTKVEQHRLSWCKSKGWSLCCELVQSSKGNHWI